ncbi:MAG: hypothetical protein KDJ38_18415 [Gammaproteobacteria bacterium]|nr:hypothetical protein [Gammaproteobacteria bacterium]
MLRKDLGSSYSPLFFLASLGAGGLAVSFFMYPMFMIKHPDTPLATFNDIYPVLTGDNPLTAGLLLADLLVIAVFAFIHFRLLIWNIGQYRKFRQTSAFATLKSSNAEVALMAIPLTLAMSINVAFVLGALFVPNLWSVVEYLFPMALVAFLAVGAYALRILGDYFVRLFTSGDFDFGANNNLSQMIAIFALTMVAVGLAAPGAMSHHTAVNAIGIFFSIFFLAIAGVLALIKLVLGFQSILQHGIAKAASPSLWILIPILTLTGITLIRLTMGLHHGFAADLSQPSLFVLTSVILSLEILIGLIGYSVMKHVGYFRDYVNGPDGDAGTFALICPGVALFVFGMFFLNFGLMKNGLVGHLSPGYFIVLAPFILVQLKTIQVFFRLSCQILSCGYCRLPRKAAA